MLLLQFINNSAKISKKYFYKFYTNVLINESEKLMRISTINSQNNNYSNKQAKPYFGISFSPQAIKGIEDLTEKAKEPMSRMASDWEGLSLPKIGRALSNLKNHPTDWKLNTLELWYGNEGYPQVGATLLVTDVHNKGIYRLDRSFKNAGVLDKKLQDALTYLLSPKFQRKARKLELKHLGEMKAAQISEQLQQAEDLEAQRLLNSITESSTSKPL